MIAWIIANVRTILYAAGVTALFSIGSFFYGFHVRGEMVEASTAKIVIKQSKVKDEIRNRPKSDAITVNRLSKGTF